MSWEKMKLLLGASIDHFVSWLVCLSVELICKANISTYFHLEQVQDWSLLCTRAGFLVEARGPIIFLLCFLFSNHNFACTKKHPRIAQLGLQNTIKRKGNS